MRAPSSLLCSAFCTQHIASDRTASLPFFSCMQQVLSMKCTACGEAILEGAVCTDADWGVSVKCTTHCADCCMKEEPLLINKAGALALKAASKALERLQSVDYKAARWFLRAEVLEVARVSQEVRSAKAAALVQKGQQQLQAFLAPLPNSQLPDNGWQAGEADTVLRTTVRNKIEELLLSKKRFSYFPLDEAARSIDTYLFNTAASRTVYADIATLRARLARISPRYSVPVMPQVHQPAHVHAQLLLHAQQAVRQQFAPVNAAAAAAAMQAPQVQQPTATNAATTAAAATPVSATVQAEMIRLHSAAQSTGRWQLEGGSLSPHHEQRSLVLRNITAYLDGAQGRPFTADFFRTVENYLYYTCPSSTSLESYSDLHTLMRRIHKAMPVVVSNEMKAINASALVKVARETAQKAASVVAEAAQKQQQQQIISIDDDEHVVVTKKRTITSEERFDLLLSRHQDDFRVKKAAKIAEAAGQQVVVKSEWMLDEKFNIVEKIV
eukprot:6156-Heterococcus_DN1.PRE.2